MINFERAWWVNTRRNLIVFSLFVWGFLTIEEGTTCKPHRNKYRKRYSHDLYIYMRKIRCAAKHGGLNGSEVRQHLRAQRPKCVQSDAGYAHLMRLTANVQHLRTQKFPLRISLCGDILL